MEDLSERLKATGIPECVEYARYPGAEVFGCPMTRKDKADAMATALLDHVDDLSDGYAAANEAALTITNEWKARAEKAEAEVLSLTEKLAECDYQKVTQSDKDRIAMLEAEVERLRWMLDEAASVWAGANWDEYLTPDDKETVLADLAARYEKEHNAGT